MPPQQIGGNFSFPPRPHLGENFHFIGHSNNQSPPCPAPPPYTTGTPTENDSIEVLNLMMMVVVLVVWQVGKSRKDFGHMMRK